MTDGVGECGVGSGASASVSESSRERAGRSGDEDGRLGVGGVRLVARGDRKRSGLCRYSEVSLRGEQEREWGRR